MSGVSSEHSGGWRMEDAEGVWVTTLKHYQQKIVALSLLISVSTFWVSSSGHNLEVEVCECLVYELRRMEKDIDRWIDVTSILTQTLHCFVINPKRQSSPFTS